MSENKENAPRSVAGIRNITSIVAITAAAAFALPVAEFNIPAPVDRYLLVPATLALVVALAAQLIPSGRPKAS